MISVITSGMESRVYLDNELIYINAFDRDDGTVRIIEED